jgi:hypothetical protein
VKLNSVIGFVASIGTLFSILAGCSSFSTLRLVKFVFAIQSLTKV